MPSTQTLTGPYQGEHLNLIYNLLFCDNPSLFANTPATSYPWNVLLTASPDITALNAAAEDKSLESRARLLAYNRLATLNARVDKKELLGVVLEVNVPGGPDVLAAYKDGTARYINHSEKLLIWETRTTESDQLIHTLFSHSLSLVSRIGPWDQPRRPFPVQSNTRINFLVADGLYFGEAPFDVLAKDALGGPVIQAAAALLDFLTQQK